MNISRALSSEEAMEFPGFSGVPVGACVIMALSFLVGTPGNLLVIWTILRNVRQRSHTVLLILHLAVADALVLITLPLWIYSFARSWVFGEAACKATVYVVYSCMYSSLFLITAMSVERFVAVCYPAASLRWKNKEKAMSTILLVLWSAAFLFGIPIIQTQVLHKVDGAEQCLYRKYSSHSQEVACLLLEILVGFVVPFSVLAVCYGCLLSRIKQVKFKTKRKSTVLVASVVAVFLFCWLPHQVANVISLVSINAEESNPNLASSLEDARAAMSFIAAALVFISSSVNPLLYAFAARYFQSSLRASGIKRLFLYISHSGTSQGTKELCVVPRSRSSQVESTTCSIDTKVSIDVDQNTHEDISS